MKHYDHTHTTVAEARECEAQRGTVITKPQPQPAKPLYIERLERQHAKATPVAKATRTATGTPAWALNPAHPNRVKYANDLLGKRETAGLPADMNEVAMHLMEGKPVSAGEIGYLIDALHGCPRKATSKPAEQEQASEPTLYSLGMKVPEGCYAMRDDAGKCHFYRVSRKAGTGHHAGRTFINVGEYASDTLHHVEYRRARVVLLALLATDMKAAQELYAAELGRCYRCGRTLTDETSRALGIGPDCRSK